MLDEHIDEVIDSILEQLPIDSLQEGELHAHNIIECVFILCRWIQTICAWVLHLHEFSAGQQRAQRSQDDIKIPSYFRCIDV